MSDVKQWSVVAGENTDPVPDGAIEGMERTQVSDTLRELFSSVRRQFEDLAWFDKAKGPSSNGFTIAKLSNTKVNLTHEATPTDASAKFPIGARVRVTDGVTFVYGFVDSVSFASPITTVTIDMDGASVVMASPTAIENNVGDGSLGRTAYSPLGVTLLQDPPEVPSIDDLGDVATLDQGHGGGIDADKLDGLHAADIVQAASAVASRLGIVNGDFSIAQRGQVIDATAAHFHINDNAKYTLDQWVLLMGDRLLHPATGLGVVDVSRENSGAVGGIAAPTCVRLSVNSNLGAPQHEKVGLIEWIPNDQISHLADSIVSLRYWARNDAPGIDTTRISLVSWSGAINNLTSVDPIDDWNVASAEPSVLFDYAISSSAPHSLSTVWQEFAFDNVAIPAGMTNLGIMIWTDDTSFSIGNWVEWTGVSMVVGTLGQTYQPEDFATNMNRCSRFYTTSFNHLVNPQSGTQDFNNVVMIGGSTSCCYNFPTPMFKEPTVNFFNPSLAGSPGKSVELDASHSDGPTPVPFPNEKYVGIYVFPANPPTGSSEFGLGVHLVAEALL